MPKSVEFIFDFASPNAYLASKVLTQIAERTGADIKIVPCLLGGIFKLSGNQAPMVAFGPIRGKMDYERLEIRRFIAAHGLHQFKLNPHFPVNTLTIMRGLIAAQRADMAEHYRAVVLAAMWEAGEKMSEPDVIHRVLTAGGLDADALLAATDDPAIKAVLGANTEAAVERGVFGIPTFFVGDDMFFGKDRLGQVEAALAT